MEEVGIYSIDGNDKAPNNRYGDQPLHKVEAAVYRKRYICNIIGFYTTNRRKKLILTNDIFKAKINKDCFIPNRPIIY